MNVRVVVIQPQTLVRQGLVGMLDAAEGVQVVAHAGTVAEGARLVHDFRPDVVLLDIDLPDHDSLGAVATVKAAAADSRVLVMSERATEAQVQQVFTESASGYTMKGITVAEFVDAVVRVAEGDLVLHPAATAILARSFSHATRGTNGHSKQAGLTPRQREIVSLLAQGLGNKQIARRLDIGVETVKTHISRILDRLGVTSRTEAVVVALRDGLVA
jgi:DNA-binding NarL/FixJ family response regulator